MCDWVFVYLFVFWTIKFFISKVTFIRSVLYARIHIDLHYEVSNRIFSVGDSKLPSGFGDVKPELRMKEKN